MSVEEIIPAVQRHLKLNDDGVAGIETWTAIAQAVGAVVPTPDSGERKPESEVESAGTFNWKLDDRSERNIATLLPPVQVVARKFLEQLAKNHISAQVISGSRTYAEQNALYEQGRSKPGRIVTNARGGYSNHNFGVAFDIGIFTQAGVYLDESPLYAAAGKIGKELGLSWGGDWKSIQDEPHFELRPKWAGPEMSESLLLDGLRERTARGMDVFA